MGSEMKDYILTLLKRLFTSEELVELFIGMAEDYVKSTDNTLDDGALIIIKAAFKNRPQP